MQDDQVQEQGRGIHFHCPRQEPTEKLHVPVKYAGLELPWSPSLLPQGNKVTACFSQGYGTSMIPQLLPAQ